MATDPTTERLLIGQRRILRILGTYTVAGIRTLENKIADAGPANQRIDPHLITRSLRNLRASHQILPLEQSGISWYTLPHLRERAEERLAHLLPIHQALRENNRVKRIGQALEIAIYRALQATDQRPYVLGGFPDLPTHSDDRLYQKEEPPRLWQGRSIHGRLDFLIIDRQSAIAAGLEAKNTREWIYPQSPEVRELLSKCCALDLIPVLVARRIHFTTTRLLIPRGGLIHQTFNQRFPVSEKDLAAQAKDKTLLGYHDILVGNDSDARLNRFVSQLPTLLPQARERFEQGREQLLRFANGTVSLSDLGLDL